MRKPRIDRVKAQYFRNGKCERCGKQAERIRTFEAPTLEECQRQADAWQRQPLRHRRCEGL